MEKLGEVKGPAQSHTASNGKVEFPVAACPTTSLFSLLSLCIPE